MKSLNQQALEVYDSWRKYVNYKDGDRMRGIRAIIRLLMENHDYKDLINAGLNYKKEMRHRPEQYLQWSSTFYSMVGKDERGEPEFTMYLPEVYDLFKAPESPCEAMEANNEVLPREESLKRMEALREKLKGAGE